MRSQFPQIDKWPRAALDWLCAGLGGYWQHCERQRTPRYRSMRSVCKNIWIGAGLLIVLNPVTALALFLSLVAALLSFALLDESEYMQ